MKKQTFEWLVLLVTLAAIGVAWLWAIRPLLISLLYIYPTSWTEADVIRHVWHFRLLQPEWVSSPPDILHWMWAEIRARLMIVFVGWLAGIILVVRRYFRNQEEQTCNIALNPN